VQGAGIEREERILGPRHTTLLSTSTLKSKHKEKNDYLGKDKTKLA
jgi:hypothetical protein